MRLVPLAVAAALLAAPAHAQLRADAAFPATQVAAGAVGAPPPGHAPPDSAARPFNRSDRFIVRAGLGGVGTVVGALGVGAASYVVLPRCSGCEDQAILGALTGAVLGAAAFAALPAMGDGCTYSDRFGQALLGAGAGAAVGALGGWAIDQPVVIFVGAVGGGALGSLWCRGREAGAGAR